MWRLLEINDKLKNGDEYWGVLDGWKPVPKEAITAGEVIDRENGPVRRKFNLQQPVEADAEKCSEYYGKHCLVCEK